MFHEQNRYSQKPSSTRSNSAKNPAACNLPNESTSRLQGFAQACSPYPEREVLPSRRDRCLLGFFPLQGIHSVCLASVSRRLPSSSLAPGVFTLTRRMLHEVLSATAWKELSRVRSPLVRFFASSSFRRLRARHRPWIIVSPQRVTHVTAIHQADSGCEIGRAHV